MKANKKGLRTTQQEEHENDTKNIFSILIFAFLMARVYLLQKVIYLKLTYFLKYETTYIYIRYTKDTCIYILIRIRNNISVLPS